QQVRHACKVRDNRVTTDVLAERERQRRCKLIVSLRLQYLPQRHQFTVLVRYLETHVRLPGDDFDHANTDHRQRARKVLRKVGDLADLHTRRRVELEPRDDGTGRYRHHFDIDVEVLELQLDQPRHRLQRILGIALLLRRGIIEQRQGRQFTRRGRLEQRYLAFLLCALAGFERGYDRLYPGRSAIGGALLFDFDCLLPCRKLASPLGTIAELAELDLERLPRGEAPAANPIH